MKTFHQFLQIREEGEAASVVYANAIGGGFIAGAPPDQPPVSVKAQKKYKTSNSLFKRRPLEK